MFLILVFLCLALVTAVPVSRAQDFVDVHMHLDGVQGGGRGGGFQEGPGPGHGPAGRPGKTPAARKKMMEMRRRQMKAQGSGGDGTASADYLVGMMGKYGVGKAVVMPPPQGYNQAGSYDYTALLEPVRKYPDRLVLGGGGGTLNPMISGTSPDAVTEALREDFRVKAAEIAEAGAHVFGEMTALHTCMNPKHHYVAAPPDHPLFLELADLAAVYDIPIDLHMEAVAEEIPTPAGLLQACDKNPATLPATIPGFERLLDHNAGARIVWQHIGWDNTGQMTPELLRRLLGAHPNLFIAIKAVPMQGQNTTYNQVFDENGGLFPAWADVFEAFPDRVVVGADEFARAPGLQGGYKKPPFFEMTWEAAGGLEAGLLRKIGGENAERVYRL